MKKLIVLLSVCLLLLGMIGVAGATTINHLFSTSGNEFISPYGGVTTETFDGASLLWTWTGNYQLLTGDRSGVGAASAPFGVSTKDISKYVSVPADANSIPQSVTVTNLGGSHDYFGIWWGSADTYNSLDFYSNGQLVAHFTGSDITSPPNAANGDQIAPSTNLYVNFVGLPSFDSFQMTSSLYAFEADNIAVGNVPVPEPATMLLLGSGLIGLAGYGRKKFFKK